MIRVATLDRECPVRFGADVEDVYVHDTRALSRTAARLYAGVKTTKDDLEVKMHDQRAALIDVGRKVAMFKEVVEHHDFSIEDRIRDAGGEEAGHAAGA